MQVLLGGGTTAATCFDSNLAAFINTGVQYYSNDMGQLANYILNQVQNLEGIGSIWKGNSNMGKKILLGHSMCPAGENEFLSTNYILRSNWKAMEDIGLSMPKWSPANLNPNDGIPLPLATFSSHPAAMDVIITMEKATFSFCNIELENWMKGWIGNFKWICFYIFISFEF